MIGQVIGSALTFPFTKGLGFFMLLRSFGLAGFYIGCKLSFNS